MFYFIVSFREFSTGDPNDRPDFGMFDEIKEENTSTKEAAIKNLSLQLINTQSSNQVLLGIFENEYLRGEKDVIHGEELALLLHFAIKHATGRLDTGRIGTLLDMLYSRLDGLGFDYIVTTIWSIGLLCSLHGAEIPFENKLKIIQEATKSQPPKESITNMPSVIFSISCMISPMEVNDEVYEVVRHLSEYYINDGIKLIEPLTASTLLMGWSRLQYHNEGLLYKIITELKREDFFFDVADQDLTNIITSLSDLHYKDDELYSILHEQVKLACDDFSPYTLFVTVQSYARVVPHMQEYYFDLYTKLFETLTNDAQTMDIQLYTNQWLSLACFKGDLGDIRIRNLRKVLIQAFSHQNPSDFSASDASNMLVAVTAMEVDDPKFIMHFVAVVLHHIKELTNVDLINMAKSSFYLRQLDEFKGVYENVHSEAVQRLTSFQPWQREALDQVYTEQNVLQDSPFLKLKMSNKA